LTPRNTTVANLQIDDRQSRGKGFFSIFPFFVQQRQHFVGVRRQASGCLLRCGTHLESFLGIAVSADSGGMAVGGEGFPFAMI
jgi:hypothetical protein